MMDGLSLSDLDKMIAEVPPCPFNGSKLIRCSDDVYRRAHLECIRKAAKCLTFTHDSFLRLEGFEWCGVRFIEDKSIPDGYAIGVRPWKEGDPEGFKEYGETVVLIVGDSNG